MYKLVLIALLGVVTQLVVGSMGMGYGVIATTALTTIAALSPAVASATVHMAELGTTGALGISHARLRNVDWQVVVRIAIPGAVGSFVGATVLTHLSTKTAAPVMSIILALLGIYILLRFVFGITAAIRGPLTIRFLGPLGLFAGFVDATGGGGWGSLATTTLLADGRLEPRKVVGSMDTSRFLVSVGAVLGFLLGMGVSKVQWPLVLALMIGGILAAPLAAYLVKHLRAEPLGVAVGGLIVLINSRVVMLAVSVPSGIRLAIYGTILVLVAAGLTVVLRRMWRADRAVTPATERVEQSVNG